MGLTIRDAAHYRKLWYEMATCFFFSSKYGLLLYMIIPSLSPQSAVAPIIGTPKDLNIYHSEIASSLDTCHAQNSAELLELSMVTCLLLVQLIGVDPTKDMTHKTYCRVT